MLYKQHTLSLSLCCLRVGCQQQISIFAVSHQKPKNKNGIRFQRLWFLERVLYHLIVSHFWLLDSKISLCLSLSRTQTHTLTHTHTLSLSFTTFSQLNCGVQLKLQIGKMLKHFEIFGKVRNVLSKKLHRKLQLMCEQLAAHLFAEKHFLGSSNRFVIYQEN